MTKEDFDGVSTLKSKLKEEKSELSKKLKLPILTTYCVILPLYNWDIIYFILFQKGQPSTIIEDVKICFPNTDNHRIIDPVILSTLYAFIFPIIQIFINICLVYFKEKNNGITNKEERDNATHQYEIQQLL